MQYKAIQSAQCNAVRCTVVQCSTSVGDSVQSHDTAKGSLRVPGQYTVLVRTSKLLHPRLWGGGP